MVNCLFPFHNDGLCLEKSLSVPPCCNNCGRCQCSGSPCLFTSGMREITQKRIQNQVRVDESQYINSLSALTIQGGKDNLPFNLQTKPYQNFFGVNQNQMSDRNRLHLQTRYVPGPGANSTKTSITRLRPGSLGPAGLNAWGVDVKHNSYNRYLGRKKAKNLQASWSSLDKPTPFIPPNQTFEERIEFYKRFSRIKYGIIGSGICNICN